MFIDDHTSSELDTAHRIFRLQNFSSSSNTVSSLSSRSVSPQTRCRSPSRNSIDAVAGSFHAAPQPDLNISLLLRFKSLPYNILKHILDDIVHEAVGSLYTGCRACRWQDWHRCICRHWQKTYCVLATLDNVIGQHVRELGRTLARSWGYSSADALGPYAAGFRFTGNVIGGYRVADFLFVDDALTALPELGFSDTETESDDLQTPTDSVFWAPSKAHKLAGIAFDATNPTPNNGFMSRFRSQPSIPTADDPPRSYSSPVATLRSRRERLLSPFKSSSKENFEMMSLKMNKGKRQSSVSTESSMSLLRKFSRSRSEAIVDLVPEYWNAWLSEKNLGRTGETLGAIPSAR